MKNNRNWFSYCDETSNLITQLSKNIESNEKMMTLILSSSLSSNIIMPVEENEVKEMKISTSLTSVKKPCGKCNKPFTLKTLEKHGGFCRRCVKSSKK